MSHPSLEVANAPERLRAIVDCIERINTEISALQSEVADLYAEAACSGFDPDILHKVIELRANQPITTSLFATQATTVAGLYIQALAA